MNSTANNKYAQLWKTNTLVLFTVLSYLYLIIQFFFLNYTNYAFSNKIYVHAYYHLYDEDSLFFVSATSY